MKGRRLTRLPDTIARRLRLPLVVAPMFLVSGPDMVLASCKSGVIGSFPGPNCRTIEDVEAWMKRISDAVTADDAPWAYNMICHSSYPRFDAELELVKKYQPPIVITALGGPQRVVEAVHAYGGLVFADVNSVEFAAKAAATGVDGLVLVCAGAGGHTGTVANVAFIEAVRTFFDGIIAVAGGMSTGRSVRAAQAMGADLAYIGTAFIPAEESLAHPDYKDMVVRSGASDIVVSASVTGVPASWLKESLKRSGLDPDNLPEKGKVQFDDPSKILKGWKDVWSAGQGVGSVNHIEPVSAIVARLARQYGACEPVPQAATLTMERSAHNERPGA
jgi:nitronate monooxygenase